LGSIRFFLSVAACLIDRDVGEHRLARVGVDTFDAWAAAHPDYPHPAQFENCLLVVTVMCHLIMEQQAPLSSIDAIKPFSNASLQIASSQ
jgi:hypothetical protein